MSGGKFNYAQHHIRDIYESIEDELERQGKPRPKKELWYDKEYYEKYPEDAFYFSHREDVLQEMRNAVYYLKMAYTYAQRVDWYLSGDDGDDNFLERLNEELAEIEYGDESFLNKE